MPSRLVLLAVPILGLFLILAVMVTVLLLALKKWKSGAGKAVAIGCGVLVLGGILFLVVLLGVFLFYRQSAATSENAAMMTAKAQAEAQMAGARARAEAQMAGARARAEQLQAQAKANANLAFGPVMERVIQARETGTNSFLDLDTGHLLTPPPDVTNALTAIQPTDLQRDNTERRWEGLDILANTRPFRYIAWLRESGADLMYNDNGQIIAFEGTYVIAHGVSSTDWNDWSGLSPESARAAVEAVGNATRNVNGGTTTITLLTNNTSSTYTTAQQLFSRNGGVSAELLTREQSAMYFFKTREGGMGILQIIGFTENSSGVKIRYKLVQQAGTSTTGNAGGDKKTPDQGSAQQSEGAGGQNETLGLYPDLTNLKGEWEIVSVEGDGDFQWQARKAGDRIYIPIVSLQAGADQTLYRPHYTISPLKTPKEVDVTSWLDNLFVTQHGLYQLEGDKLTLCMAPYQEPRPKQFATVPGKSTLFVLKRIASQDELAERPFGPVFERVLTDPQSVRERAALNLGSSEFIALPAGIELKTRNDSPGYREALNWTRVNQMDLVTSITLAANGRISRALLGADLLVIPVANEQWDKATSRDVVLQLNRAIQEFGFISEAPELTTDGTLPATFFIQTRNNLNGILQITGFTGNPRGVKIRYKLVQNAGSKTAAAPSPTSDASTKAPDVGARAADLQARLVAAEQIMSFSERDKALAIIAQDAARDGDATIAHRALDKITAFTARDAAALEAARALAKAGQRADAIELAKMITSFVERDKALKELAQ